jgi:hypothetical protein
VGVEITDLAIFGNVLMGLWSGLVMRTVVADMGNFLLKFATTVLMFVVVVNVYSIPLPKKKSKNEKV